MGRQVDSSIHKPPCPPPTSCAHWHLGVRGGMVAPQLYPWEPLDMILFGKRVSVDIIKVRVLRRCGPQIEYEGEKPQGRWLAADAGDGVMWPGAQECPGALEAGRGGKDPPRTPRGSTAWPASWFRILASRLGGIRPG